jgi:hypothetical protein
MTYDLRRLRRKGLIRRIPRSQRYELTELGRDDRRLRLAVCRASATARRRGRAPGRDRRNAGVVRPQAPRQDRTARTRCGSESCWQKARLPEAWIASEHIRQWRSRLHLRKALIDERTQWLLRIRSTLYHHGLSAGAPAEISSPTGRKFLASVDLPSDAVERIAVALGMVDTLEREIHQIERSLRRLARHQTGCQALITQGSSSLRWALYETAQSATRRQSPDYHDYHALRARGLTHTPASLTIARKIARRSYHLLHALGPAAPAPIPE